MRYAFLIGVARSGTSILGELIAHHPDVFYIFEASKVWELAGHGEHNSHRLTEAHATPEVAAQIRTWFEQYGISKRILVEKCPRNTLRIPYVRAIFPEAKIIHIVRDGRDVACSMVPGCGGDHWSHLRPPSWQRFFLNHRGVVRCALTWLEAINIALDDLARTDHLQVRYEDLVYSPRDVAREVLSYLELDDHPAVASFCEKIQNDTKGSYHAAVQGIWYRDDHSVRVGRYRENMTPEELRVINGMLEPTLQSLGYRLDSDDIPR